MTGVNEHDPVWDAFSPVYVDATTAYEIPESSPIGTSIVTIGASDADTGVDGELLYSLSAITPGMYT